VKKKTEIEKKIKNKKKKDSIEELNPNDYYVDIKKCYEKKKEKESNENESNEKKVEIVFNEKNQVSLSSITKLIEELTRYKLFFIKIISVDRYDPQLLSEFLLTYRSFTTKEVIFDILEDRFNYLPQENCSFLEFGRFKKEKLNKIRIRIAQTLKNWIENFFKFDFVDEESIKRLNKFIDLVESSNEESMSKLLKNNLKNQYESIKISQNNNNVIDYPKILLPKKNIFFDKKGGYKVKKNQNKILEWPVLEIARQITLIEFEIFKSIEPREVNFKY
jgi:son of sevenless-like protein